MKVLMITLGSGDRGQGEPVDASRRLSRALLEFSGGEVTDVVELSATDLAMHGGSPVARRGDGVFVVGGGHSDALRLISHRSSWANRSLSEWLVAVAPDVVHFHDLAGVGADLVPLIRRAVPRAVMVLTAHDLLLACANSGTLVRASGQLCDARSSLECADCVAVQPVDIMLRDDFFRRLVGLFDVLLAPTTFAAERLSSWLGGRVVQVVRDCPVSEPGQSPRVIATGEGRCRIGFFGDLAPEGGLHVLLDALIELKGLDGHPVELEVFGSADDDAYWEDEIVPRFEELAGGSIRATYSGVFRPDDASAVMAMVDWVAIPTLGWEASPDVLMSALATGRPSLAGNVGGMREILDLTGAGRSVAVGSIGQWMDALVWATDPDNVPAWDEFHDMAVVPWSVRDVVDQHVTRYWGG
ncbi:MAG: glycosyltransferase [Actinomycetes bacterium]